MPSDDIVARLRGIEGGYNLRNLFNEAAAEIERLCEYVRALEIEIERYRIQCVRISDLERMLEVQDTQLEHAQRALRILEGHKHEQQG